MARSPNNNPKGDLRVPLFIIALLIGVCYNALQVNNEDQDHCEMRLYHHTNSSNLESIKAQGLVPAIKSHSDAPPHEPVVWLTTLERWFLFRNVNDVPMSADSRITVTTGANSRRLVHWVTWLKKHHPNALSSILTNKEIPVEYLDRTYFYQGTIQPSGLGEVIHFKQCPAERVLSAVVRDKMPGSLWVEIYGDDVLIRYPDEYTRYKVKGETLRVINQIIEQGPDSIKFNGSLPFELCLPDDEVK